MYMPLLSEVENLFGSVHMVDIHTDFGAELIESETTNWAYGQQLSHRDTALKVGLYMDVLLDKLHSTDAIHSP